MSDPTTVTGAQVHAAYDALGLDPERWGAMQLMMVDRDTDQVLVRRSTLNGGTKFTQIPIDWSES